MTARHVRLYAFASTKGGVGKSTLAVASANFLAQRGDSAKRVVVLDLDLTGSSLADGLNLCAPELELDGDGRFAPVAPSLGWLSLDATRHRRYERSRLNDPNRALLPYVNDALTAPTETRVADWLWRDTETSVRYLPSSSVPADVQVATGVLVEMPGDDWRDSLVATLVELCKSNTTVTDIVLDLPPGTWGFAHGALASLHALGAKEHEAIEWSTNAILVTSPDANALVPSIEYAMKTRHLFNPDLRIVVNRATEAPNRIRSYARKALAAPLAQLEPQQLLQFVDEDPNLERIFKGGPIPQFSSPIADALRLVY